MIHHKEQTKFNKRKKKYNQYKIMVLSIIVIIMFVAQYYLLPVLLVILAFLLHELLCSDHIFYDVRQDHQYNLGADFSEQINLSDSFFLCKEHYKDKSLFLELDLQSSIRGFIFDPYIELTLESTSGGTCSQRQFFERNLKGKRYLNLSHICSNQSCDTIALQFKYCKLIHKQATMHIFSDPDLNKQKILLISPHADDAEIAAYGLYSKNDSFIATITAGEVEAEYYESISKNKHEASRLKGRLRAWDSISVPMWAGLAADKAIQLGYFCLTLKQMQENPQKQITSLTADIDDTRYFRLFNSMKLPSDEHGKASWETLVIDLQQLIKKIKPAIIVTAHPQLDPHSDHFFATMACLEACEKLQYNCDFLLYANHFNHTDMHPFGLSGSLCSLPPEFKKHKIPMSLLSLKTDRLLQKNKIVALGMMHDLSVPISLKKKLRQKLQSLIVGREQFQFGDNDYFRKAIRQNELFYKVDREQLKQLIVEN